MYLLAQTQINTIVLYHSHKSSLLNASCLHLHYACVCVDMCACTCVRVCVCVCLDSLCASVLYVKRPHILNYAQNHTTSQVLVYHVNY